MQAFQGNFEIFDVSKERSSVQSVREFELDLTFSRATHDRKLN